MGAPEDDSGRGGVAVSQQNAPVGEAANSPNYFPTSANDASYIPRHTKTQSTLAPTSEYVRYLLLALPARYVPRGIAGLMFETKHFNGNALGRGLAKVSEASRRLFKITGPHAADHAAAFAYNSIMGVGSLALTSSYSHTVYKDIQNIFGEAVAMETGKSPEHVTSLDFQHSDNHIVQKTMHNFHRRTAKRVLMDLLFFPAAAARSGGVGDLMVGGKALQAFGETWKRKTTMFEDLITFVNNKINPRNGLGQAIMVGEVFDLYQHYTEAFQPERMFTNVLERGSGEGAVWAKSQPIFERMTELMNLTYAYKHSSVLDPHTGHAVHQADFGLPKFIYLLGHDMIDVRQPERTMATIEIANRFGIPAVKEMQTMLAQGASLEQVTQRFPIPEVKIVPKQVVGGKNGVIAKGSTMQLDQADTLPAQTVDATSVADHTKLLAGINGGQALI